MACDADCPGVCSCNGQFFCNACGANAAGLDVSSKVDCLPDAGAGGVYSAYALSTNLPRFVVFKADPVRDLCFRVVVVVMSGGPSVGTIKTPAGWSIQSADVTNHAVDCALANGAGAPWAAWSRP